MSHYTIQGENCHARCWRASCLRWSGLSPFLRRVRLEHCRYSSHHSVSFIQEATTTTVIAPAHCSTPHPVPLTACICTPYPAHLGSLTRSMYINQIEFFFHHFSSCAGDRELGSLSLRLLLHQSMLCSPMPALSDG